jgi:peptide methionine sulfoxide reductase msrA/msrB
MMNKKYNKLTPEEEKVIIHKENEPPFSGQFYQHKEKGIYTCKRCDAELYRSDGKFESDCGWPSFDDEIEGAIERQPDTDHLRTEIICSQCGAHLGHVFEGENQTPKNVRHCVNSISLNFKNMNKNIEKAYFAGGCFWGVEYHFQKLTGVISTKVGYMGGSVDQPTYEQVCAHRTGHAEALKIVFDTKKISFEELVKHFFEIHDPTQINRQGPDLGDQYRSVIFYTDQRQKDTAQKLIDILKEKGYKIVTELKEADTFWEAEEYHQKYYSKKNAMPYCHVYTKRF